MHYVYVLQSLKEKNWLYTGQTDDLKQRYIRHQKGGVISTEKYRPLRLICYEAYFSKKDATAREYNLKHNSQQKEQLKTRLQYSLMLG